MCVFHVGGTADTESSVSRWEFFIGDQPNSGIQDGSGVPQPVEQIALIESFLEAGEVGLSADVIEQVCLTLIFAYVAQDDGFAYDVRTKAF